MKKVVIILCVCFGMLLYSCEPDPSKEGINLPPMEMGLQITPDTAFIKLGDTVWLRSSISSTLSNGVKIEDGKATIDLFIGYINQVPVVDFAFEAAIPNDHLQIYSTLGGINISSNTSKITDIYALPYGDSIQVEIAFIPLKKGTYAFEVQSMFYEGKQGKTRTVPKFDMLDTHWDLQQIPNQTIPLPGTTEYYTSYLFAVTD